MTDIGFAGPVAFVGLGQMGLPMAKRLVEAGFEVRGVDPSPAAREAFAAAGGRATEAARQAAQGAAAIITMLPDGEVVRSVLTGADGLAAGLAPGTLVVDMSSSAPMATRALAEELGRRGLRFLDAPVSGGVRRAVDGSLAIMAGGDAAVLEAARPLFAAMGRTIVHTGPAGSGHAMKALNNYVSAAGLVAAAEAIIVGRRFGLEAETIVDVLNASTGRNNSTEVKMKQFVISESFASGFSLSLMTKDLKAAADLARDMGLDLPQIAQTAKLWQDARSSLPQGADHTEIYRFLDPRG